MASYLLYSKYMKILLALLVTGCTAGQLHIAANVTEGAAYTSLACDAGSTHSALQSTKFVETNPVMGARPDGANELEYFGSIGGVVALANRAFSHGHNKIAGDIWRIAMNTVVIGIEVDAVQSNTNLGVKLCGM